MSNILKVGFVELSDNMGLMERKNRLPNFGFGSVIADIINQKKEFRRKSRFEEKMMNYISFYQF